MTGFGFLVSLEFFWCLFLYFVFLLVWVFFKTKSQKHTYEEINLNNYMTTLPPETLHRYHYFFNTFGLYRYKMCRFSGEVCSELASSVTQII